MTSDAELKTQFLAEHGVTHCRPHKAAQYKIRKRRLTQPIEEPVAYVGNIKAAKAEETAAVRHRHDRYRNMRAAGDAAYQKRERIKLRKANQRIRAKQQAIRKQNQSALLDAITKHLHASHSSPEPHQG